MTNEEAIKKLKFLKSFHNGSYGESLNMAIKALEAHPCIEDYPTCTECEHYDSEKHYCPRFCQVIKDTLAEAQPKKGEWILDNNGWNTICNCCKQGEWKGYVPTPDEATKWMPICPKCGAKMEEE